MFWRRERRRADHAFEAGGRTHITVASPPHNLRATVDYTSLMRILIYDHDCKGPGPTHWLAHSFRLGVKVFGGARFFDAVIPSESWAQALRGVLCASTHEAIEEIQFWGHGKWGRALIGEESLDRAVVTGPGELPDLMKEVGTRMPSPTATLWFRTCETLGAQPGQEFARHLSEQIGARVAGHTYIIGPLQSGLHILPPGEAPSWPAMEGVAVGSVEKPRRAHWSSLAAPNTITCLRRTLPTTLTRG